MGDCNAGLERCLPGQENARVLWRVQKGIEAPALEMAGLSSEVFLRIEHGILDVTSWTTTVGRHLVPSYACRDDNQT